MTQEQNDAMAMAMMQTGGSETALDITNQDGMQAMLAMYAKDARDTLVRTYTVSLKVLIIVSLPVALLTTFYAELIILVVG